MSDIEAIAFLVEKLTAVAVLVESGEIYSNRRSYAANGMFSWKSTRVQFQNHSSIVPVLDRLLDFPFYSFIIGAQFLSSLLLIFSPPGMMSFSLISILLLNKFLGRLRLPYGRDGSDHMRFVLLAGLFFFYLAPSMPGKTAGLLFICGQFVLAYFVSGITKIISPEWRNGTALLNIMTTDTFGDQRVAKIFARYPLLCLILSWTVILFESFAPLLIFLGTIPCLVFLTVSLLFHVSVAVIMGLNGFLLSFLAAYPTALFAASLLR